MRLLATSILALLGVAAADVGVDAVPERRGLDLAAAASSNAFCANVTRAVESQHAQASASSFCSSYLRVGGKTTTTTRTTTVVVTSPTTSITGTSTFVKSTVVRTTSVKSSPPARTVTPSAVTTTSYAKTVTVTASTTSTAVEVVNALTSGFKCTTSVAAGASKRAEAVGPLATYTASSLVSSACSCLSLKASTKTVTVTSTVRSTTRPVVKTGTTVSVVETTTQTKVVGTLATSTTTLTTRTSTVAGATTTETVTPVVTKTIAAFYAQQSDPSIFPFLADAFATTIYGFDIYFDNRDNGVGFDVPAQNSGSTGNLRPNAFNLDANCHLVSRDSTTYVTHYFGDTDPAASCSDKFMYPGSPPQSAPFHAVTCRVDMSTSILHCSVGGNDVNFACTGAPDEGLYEFWLVGTAADAGQCGCQPNTVYARDPTKFTP